MTTLQNTPNLPAVAQNGSAVATRGGSLPPAVGNRKTRRAIKKVIDARGAEPVIMPVDALLDGMTAVDLTAVRRAIAQGRGKGNILFRCAHCNSPVYLAVSHTTSSGDGRGAHFKHHGGTPADCDWRTPDVMRDTGAGQFGGLQEGEPHWRLKHCLADSIRCDPDFSEPLVDKHFIKIGDGHRKPDVFTTYKGKPIAIELQLARMSLTTFTERTAAYRAAGITLVWVTSAHELSLLNNQSFRDLYLAAGGRILAVDAASYERSEETSVLHLRELSLEPCIQHPFAVYNRWRSRMVGPDVIFMPDGQRHAEGQRAYAAALAEKLQAKAPGLTETIASTVASGADLTLVAAEWSALAKLVGARELRQSIQDELPRVLRWLQAVERLNNATGHDKEVAGKVVAACAAAIVAGRIGKHWVPLIEHVADAVSAVAAVLTPELRTKMTRLKASGGKLHPMHAYHRHMISALHPWLAFWLLAKAPNGMAPHQRLP
ncbi:competence protein CoiA family protein [Devosia sp. A369]